MKVKKRNGELQEVDFNKITKRIEALCFGLDMDYIKPTEVAKKVIAGLYDGVTTEELDNLASEVCGGLVSTHPDYSLLGGRIVTSNIQKKTSDNFYDNMLDMNHIISQAFVANLQKLSSADIARIQDAIDYDKSFNFDLFGINTLKRAYLLKGSEGKEIKERPQHLLMREALTVTMFNVDKSLSTYELLSEGIYTHATPTLFNAGTKREQLSSCFLLDMKEDSIDGIYDTLKQCAKISQSAGGIGLSIHKVRAKGSYISGTGGVSNGIVPMLRNFNETARYVDQGGGKRKGSFAIYLEPWHADIFDFLELKKNHGKEEMRARDLFYAMWNSDLFMKRVEANEEWSLFCPKECPLLIETYGDDFEQAYKVYESQGKALRTVKAQDLWFKIMESQVETGTPYMLYKDACNAKSNQKNLGIIKSSNLCFTGDTMVAVADGRNAISIKQLAEESKKVNEFPVYSARPRINKKGWKTEIKNAVAFKTGTKTVVEVTLSNGDTFKCTPDHEIALSSGGYCQAIDLVGKKVESFYTFTSVGNGQTPYRHIDSISNGHSKQHLMIYDFNADNPRKKGEHIDHIDKNALYFDAYTNLDKLEESEHRKKTGKEFSGNNNMVHRLKDAEKYAHNQSMASTATKNANFSGIDNFELIRIGKEIVRIHGCLTYKNYVKYRDETGIKIPLSFTNYRFGGSFVTYKKYVSGELIYTGEYEKDDRVKATYEDKDLPRKEYCKSIKDGIEVVSVKVLGQEDVYDLTVEDNHNFYIVTSSEDKSYLNCQGVLVHNCTEIIEYTDENEVAVCNLASIALPKFVKDGVFDFMSLFEVTQTVTENLNNVIDVNYYPVEEARNSNLKHRPIGIGVQGLADVFAMLKMPFDSKEAKQLNEEIFEAIYAGAVTRSCELAKMFGHYSSFEGSPISKGKFQFDLWGEHPTTDRFDWEQLRSEVVKHGTRNSLLVAPMPTASTSQILGNNECFEPFTYNIYKRGVLSGEFTVINKHLVKDLIDLGLWNHAMKQEIVKHKGSVQNLDLPQWIKDVYKTSYEISQKVIIDMASDRGKYICQSQSMNLFIGKPTIAKLTSMHFYAWKKGLKTGMYYLRTKPAQDAQQFTVDNSKQTEVQACSIDNPDCDSCGA